MLLNTNVQKIGIGFKKDFLMLLKEVSYAYLIKYYCTKMQ